MNIRAYKLTDTTAIEELYRARGLAFDLDLFLWKKQAPVSFSWVGETEGQIVAHYSIMELPLFQGFRTGFAVDAVVASSHGRIEEIAKLIQHGLNEVKLAGFDLVVGFPNERMKHIKRFLGWNTVGSYVWKESNGDSLPNQVNNSVENNVIEPYEQWRWSLCPRTYFKMTDSTGFVKARFGHLNNGTLAALWHDPAHWQVIADTYDFVYLEQSEISNADNAEVLVPLYYSFHEDSSSWKWPFRWPLETIEGVTLGW